MSERIEGYVDHIIFRNSENGYTVMVLAAHEDEITCVGSFSYLSEGRRWLWKENIRPTRPTENSLK